MKNTHASASAPGKLLLFGDHAVVYGQPCIVTAVDQRISVEVENINVPELIVAVPEYSKLISDLGKGDVPKNVAFLEMAYKIFLEKFPQSDGVKVTTHSDFSSQFGFGSSSAVTVAFIKALTKLYQLELNNRELFSLCYQTILNVQKVGSGFDAAAAIWGGTIFYVKPAMIVEPILLHNLPFIVGYTGVKADTTKLIKGVARLRQNSPEKVDKIFENLGATTTQAKEALLEQDWQKVGELMKQQQALLRGLQISTGKLDTLISAAENAGALGAKLSGAGGGDCMIAVVEEKNRASVERAIVAAGGQVLPVKMSAKGVE